MRVPTVTINGANGPLVMNETDYDEALHGPKIADVPDFVPEPPASATAPVQPAPVPGEIAPSMEIPGAQIAPLMPVEPTPLAPAPAVVAPVEPIQPIAPAPAPAPAAAGRGTAEIGGKWYIVDATGAKLINKGYADEATARAALTETA